MVVAQHDAQRREEAGLLDHGVRLGHGRTGPQARRRREGEADREPLPGHDPCQVLRPERITTDTEATCTLRHLTAKKVWLYKTVTAHWNAT